MGKTAWQGIRTGVTRVLRKSRVSPDGVRACGGGRLREVLQQKVKSWGLGQSSGEQQRM